MTELPKFNDPPPYAALREQSESPLLFLCDHGGDAIPESLIHYDWTMAQGKHIAYDIGAARVTQYLSKYFSAPAIIGVYSRLVVDLNRFPFDPTYIANTSDGINIPANEHVSPDEFSRRTDRFFAPYHMRVERQIDAMQQRGISPRLILVHSMTDKMDDIERREHIDIMHDKDTSLAYPMLDTLRQDSSICVGENSPYTMDETDYTAVVHGVRRALPHMQIEMRQDLLKSADNINKWSEILCKAIEASELCRVESPSPQLLSRSREQSR